MAEQKIDISIYVPCLNEAANIAATLKTIFAAMKPFPYSFEILAVDDGSTDQTLALLRRASSANPPAPIRIIENEESRGLGFNYFATALLARGEYYMLVNGDNAEPLETLQAIFSQKGKADMVIPYFGPNDKRNFARRTISFLFTTLVNVLTFNRIRYYNGPVLHRTENVRLHHAETRGFGYQAELICKLLNEGKSYVHVLIRNSDREWGFSKAFRPANFLSVANSLLHIFLRQIVFMAWVLVGYKKQKKQWKPSAPLSGEEYKT